MKAQDNNFFKAFGDFNSLELNYDFDNDGKVKNEDVEIPHRYIGINDEQSVFGFDKNEFELLFSELSNNTLSSSEALSKYKYMSAIEAGVNEVDLLTLANMNIPNELSSADINILDEEILPALQGNDTLTSIEEQFSDILSSKITDYEEKINDTSYMEGFVKEMDINNPI